ncbi:hypothetical protein [Foetidibacter luteolus]|uniref:hypothetical protein n=1 Tax=Foetidibacter luteolus TaxID=2608880 RepID=UPI00129A627C|nr:hypothetical protein [Foetidibacter luteolus]
MRNATFLILVLTLLIAGCGPTVQYIGRNYTPTANVDIYFSTTDIKKSYEVMGKIDGQSMFFDDFQKIQDKITDEAKKRGADAVLIYDMEERVIATSQNTNSTSTTETHRQWWQTNSATVTTAVNQTKRVLHADFLKYKDGN